MGFQWLIATGRSLLTYISSPSAETELPNINRNSVNNLITQLQNYVNTCEDVKIMVLFKQKPDFGSLSFPVDYLSTISSGERYIIGCIPTQIILDWLCNNSLDEQIEEIVLLD